MSDMTPCNYCEFQRMKREAKTKKQKISTVPEPHPPHFPNGVRVLRDGKPAGVWFGALGDHCEC